MPLTVSTNRRLLRSPISHQSHPRHNSWALNPGAFMKHNYNNQLTPNQLVTNLVGD